MQRTTFGFEQRLVVHTGTGCDCGLEDEEKVCGEGVERATSGVVLRDENTADLEEDCEPLELGNPGSSRNEQVQGGDESNTRFDE